MLKTKSKVLLLVHGMGRLRWSMAHLIPVARRYGYRAISFEYRSTRGSIRDHAESLIKYLKENTSPESEDLFIIGHSLGCVISTCASMKEQWMYPGARAVFLGPPNQGSSIAGFVARYPFISKFFGEPLHELSGWLPRKNPPLQIGVIAGVISYKRSLSPFFSEPNDMLVTVSETKLEGMTDHRIIRCPHALMMYHPQIIKEAFYFFNMGKFIRSDFSPRDRLSE